MKFDPAKERESVHNLRANLQHFKERVVALVDMQNPSAIAKAQHYIRALDAQLAICDRTEERIDDLTRPFPSPPPRPY